MVPAKMTWKENCITMEEKKSEDDNMMIDENVESKDDTPAAMDVNMVFALPAEFRAPKIEVAELVLGPQRAIFEKLKKPEKHLKPLYIKGHIDGKPTADMLVDGGAGVNVMPFSVFTKLGRKESELMRTSMGLSGFT